MRKSRTGAQARWPCQGHWFTARRWPAMAQVSPTLNESFPYAPRVPRRRGACAHREHKTDEEDTECGHTADARWTRGRQPPTPCISLSTPSSSVAHSVRYSLVVTIIHLQDLIVLTTLHFTFLLLYLACTFFWRCSFRPVRPAAPPACRRVLLRLRPTISSICVKTASLCFWK